MAAPFPSAGTGINFVPEIWSKKLNIRLYATTVLAQITNTKYEGEIKGQGSQVHIREKPSVAISDYVGTVTYAELDDTKQILVIDKAKMYAFKVDDILEVQSNIELQNNAIDDATNNMRVAIDTDVLAGTYGDATTSFTAAAVDATNVLNFIVQAGQALDELNIGSDGRFLVLPPWMCAFIKLSDLKDASLAGDGTSILRNGRVGIIDRFTIYMSNLLTVTGTGTEWNVIGGTKDAITFASQYIKTETLRLEGTFGDGVRGLNVYGYKVIHADSLVHIIAKKV
ncbi:MAG: hypothetical protein DRQ40_09760 [Gammaproteobacteria bacterium]|nr:MAG: hypothetical protein DRQ40_09760 [Gammaproteobacteria bacterium]